MKVTGVCTSLIGGAILALICFFTVPDLSAIGFVIGVPIGAGGFVAYISRLAKTRQEKMTAQLPQVLETMVSSLRAGSPVMEVFKVLADVAPDPIRAEFKR